MVLLVALIALATLAPSAPEGEAPCALASARDISRFLENDPSDSLPFAITGLVYHVRRDGHILVADATGRVAINSVPALLHLNAGAVVELAGSAKITPAGDAWTIATRGRIIGRRAVPPPAQLAVPQLDPAQHNLLEVSVAGTVMRIFDDDADAHYRFLLLKDGAAVIPVAFPRSSVPRAEELVDALVKVRGVYYRRVDGLRKCSGPFVLSNPDGGIIVETPPPADPFSAPPIDRLHSLAPAEVARLGRRTFRGTVTASWGGRAMIRDGKGRTIRLEMAEDNPSPRSGAEGIAVGYPETDLFSISLSGVLFKETGFSDETSEERPIAINFDSLASDCPAGYLHRFQGELVVAQGILRSILSAGSPEKRMILDCGKLSVFADFSALNELPEDLALGSRVEVRGRCLVETENWRADSIFPRFKNLAVIMRQPSDLRIIERPSWWTPARLTAVIGLLLVSLAGSYVWNQFLRRLVHRRGQELFRSQAEAMKAEVRLCERTRLAVELHDTISQTLAGAAMRVDAAHEFLATDLPRARQQLALASKTIASCQNDLRNCLWDLRNRVLDERDIAAAVRRTILPVAGKTSLNITADIPRRLVPDDSLHALLMIVRELAFNAIRHGRADTVDIDLACDGKKLKLTVSDNGVGFAPTRRPGVHEGHFGLQGIDERIKQLGGSIKINSSPGKGTRICVWIKSPF